MEGLFQSWENYVIWTGIFFTVVGILLYLITNYKESFYFSALLVIYLIFKILFFLFHKIIGPLFNLLGDLIILFFDNLKYSAFGFIALLVLILIGKKIYIHFFLQKS